MASKKLQLCKKQTNKQTKTGDELVFMSVPNYSQTSLYGHPVYKDSFSAILFFSPFSVVRPTQIFGIFRKKKVTT